ncbi:MAG TPA: lytic murein transglycosylase [Phenylobacterium sp.]|jgi:lytic murein transglycosylase|uniref:lytic murein transglycosylase n=1 Tax=Phenylobacterium sp. TaxID=1871053 RepID=UPI002D4140EB|nr:lytic murein transglycosylase [Phenylobacterium sp.]HZZ66850.1 lytic murein transglycosylase [Phenylobacterium sp.]
MRARHFLALACLAILTACASPAARPPLPTRLPTTPSARPAPRTPPEAAPPPAVTPIAPPAASGDMVFDAWASEFYGKALKAGIDRAVLGREMAGLTPDPRVTARDSRQPEFSQPISTYIKGAVTPGAAATGERERADVPQLPDIEQRFGVPREILIAIWARESAYGAIQGDFDVIRSMASLAAQGRRRAWAEGELISALRIIQTGQATREQLKGSWAGAMGQTQFIPSAYLSTAVDGGGDGRRDIWTSPADALASAANLLAKAGWRRGESWAREVTVPSDFDFSMSEGPKLTPEAWGALGVLRADGLPWDDADKVVETQLIAPAGAQGPIFLLFPNHFVIRRYNNSVAYALAVGLLADKIAGEPPLVRPWPPETPLSLADRMTAQRALAVLGFSPGTPDGIVGSGTRTALRAWQRSRGLTADGYLSLDMVERLRADAGAPPPTLASEPATSEPTTSEPAVPTPAPIPAPAPAPAPAQAPPVPAPAETPPTAP